MAAAAPESDGARRLAARSRRRSAAVPHSLVDVSHRQVGIRGRRSRRARTLLNAGCPLDLDVYGLSRSAWRPARCWPRPTSCCGAEAPDRFRIEVAAPSRLTCWPFSRSRSRPVALPALWAASIRRDRIETQLKGELVLCTPWDRRSAKTSIEPAATPSSAFAFEAFDNIDMKICCAEHHSTPPRPNGSAGI